MVRTEEFILKYSSEIRKGNAAIFAGAGLSRASGFVNWKDLVRPMAQSVNLDVDHENDLTAVAQYYCNEHGGRGNLNQEISNRFMKDVELNENVRILTRLPISTYWTTNFDHLIEDALKENHRKADVKITKEQLAITVADRDAIVYKMHGDVSYPNEAVLTKDDFERYDINRPLFRSVLQGDLISKTFLFIGFSFEDPNLIYVLARINSLLDQNKREHYCFFKNVEKLPADTDEEYEYKKIQQKLREHDLEKRYGIQAVFVDSYAEITEILKKIEFAASLKNVFISGAAEEFGSWSADNASNLAFKLSKSLVKKDYRVVSGYGLGLGSPIVHGALDEIYASKYKHTDNYLTLRPFPQGITDPTKRQQIFTQYRDEMIDTAGIALFMFGNKIDKTSGKIINSVGCWEEYQIALKHHCYIIPLASTGYEAREIMKDVKKNIADFGYLTDFIDRLEKTIKEDDLVGLVMEIISAIEKDAVKYS